MKELMFLEDKTVRSKNLDRIGILEKVGNLLLLSNNEHATTKQISDFFETPKKTIESLFADNKEEIEMSGAFFLQGIDLKDFKTNLPNPGDLKRVPSCWLFPKRAILNIGMLLRDSEVAKRLREALLDVVEAAPEAIKKVTKLIATEKLVLDMLEEFVQDELTFKKTKQGILESLNSLPFQKRLPLVKKTQLVINEKIESLDRKELTKAYDLLTLYSLLSEHLVDRIDHSKFLMVTRRNKKIEKLEEKLETVSWKPDFSIQTNYSCFSKNAMYCIVNGKMVTSKAYANWKKHFPYDLIIAGLKKEFYTQPFEWCASGSFYEELDASNIITPVQDQIAKALNRDDKEIYFKGFIYEEMSTVQTWKESKMKLYFRLLPKKE
jgi:hypothetical protein